MISSVFSTETYSEQDIVISNSRHHICLKNTKSALDEAFQSVEKKMSGEFISTDIRSAIDQLSEIVGKISSEDVLNNIFSKFCIGK